MRRALFQPSGEAMSGGTTPYVHARRTLLIAAILSAVLSAAACGEARTGTPAVANAAAISTTKRDTPMATTGITIKDFAFEPATLTVAAGSKVVWTNRDEEPHLIVSADGQFHKSPAMDTDDNYAAVFAKPGTYTYFCSIHPHMVGKIIVK
jgi:plastocyanin